MQNYKTLLSGLFICTTAVTLTAYAAAGNDNKLYFTEQLGWTSMASNTVNPYTLKQKKHFGFRFSGGYLFPINDSFSLGPEVGYGGYGKVSYQNAAGLVSNYTLRGWDVLANLRYTFNALFNFYVKAGIGQFSQHLDIQGPGVTPGGFYQQALAPEVAVAASYNLGKRTELSVNYAHIFANSAPLTSKQPFTFTNVNRVASVDAVMMGLTYYLN